jgi:predicted metal-dependent hydrolase
MQNVLSSRSRMERVVSDIVFDFSTKRRLNKGSGNAMLVAASIFDACKYFSLFQKTEFKGVCAVVTSYNPHAQDVTKEVTGANTETDKQFIYNTYTELLKDVDANPGQSKSETYEEWAKDLFAKEPASMKLLIVVDKLLTGFDAPPMVELQHNQMLLTVRPGTDEHKREAIVEGWYREQLKEAAPSVIARWEPLMGVKVERFFVQRMKTKWGSCSPGTRSIRLNTELAKKPRQCLEYIIVHEMTHLLEPTHNSRFIGLMDRFMPQWQFYRDELNRLPVRHELWAY